CACTAKCCSDSGDRSITSIQASPPGSSRTAAGPPNSYAPCRDSAHPGPPASRAWTESSGSSTKRIVRHRHDSVSSITGRDEHGASRAEVEVRVARHRQARLTADEISQLPQLNDESPNLWKNERSAVARDLLSAAVRCF